MYGTDLRLGLHKRPASAIDALEVGAPQSELSAEEPSTPKAPTGHPDDTESDPELQNATSTKTPEKPAKTLSIEQVALDVPHLIRELSIPAASLGSHPPIPNQFITTKQYSFNTKPH